MYELCLGPYKVSAGLTSTVLMSIYSSRIKGEIIHSMYSEYLKPSDPERGTDCRYREQTFIVLAHMSTLHCSWA